MLKKTFVIILTLLISINAYAIDSTTVDGRYLDEFEITQWDSMTEPAVAPANSGRVYYNGTSDDLRLSLNGGAYSPFVTTSSGSSLYLLLDQTTPQTVINDAPIFEEGIAIGDDAKTIKKIDANTVGLYINGELIMSWNNSPDGGQYQGFGCFTYPA